MGRWVGRWVGLLVLSKRDTSSLLFKCMMRMGGKKIVGGCVEEDKGGEGSRKKRSRRWRWWAGLCSQVGSVQRKEVAGNRKEVAAVRRALLQEVATSRRTRKR